jgi:hypothetical protein
MEPVFRTLEIAAKAVAGALGAAAVGRQRTYGSGGKNY